MSPEDDKLQMSKSIDSCLKYFFRKEIVCQETSQNILCLYPPRSCMLLVQGADDDATTSAFSRECCKVNGKAVKAVCGGLCHLRK